MGLRSISTTTHHRPGSYRSSTFSPQQLPRPWSTASTSTSSTKSTTSTRTSLTSAPTPLQSDQQILLTACTTGDIPTLQVLFNKHGINAGTAVQTDFSRKSQASLDWLLLQAISARSAASVAYLIQTLPFLARSEALHRAEVVTAVLNNPDAETLRVLLAASDACEAHEFRLGLGLVGGSDSDTSLGAGGGRGLANFRFDDRTCFLNEACMRPPGEIVPVVHVLLEQGADVEFGCGALYAAVMGGQPFGLIERIVRRGPDVGEEVLWVAIAKGRADVVRLLLEPGVMRVERVDSETLMAKVMESGEGWGEMGAVVDEFERRRKAQEKLGGGMLRLKRGSPGGLFSKLKVFSLVQ